MGIICEYLRVLIHLAFRRHVADVLALFVNAAIQTRDLCVESYRASWVASCEPGLFLERANRDTQWPRQIDGKAYNELKVKQRISQGVV